MPIRDTLRKAAGLFVELEPSAASEPKASGQTFEELMAKADPSKINLTDDLKAAAEPATSAPKTVEQIVKEAPGPNLDQIKVEPEKVKPAAPGGDVNFGEIYRQANLPSAAFTAEQALDMISALPAELPLEAKRQTVKVTMAAMGQATGVNSETVVTDASRKLAALASYADGLSKRTSDYVAATQLEISQLEAKILEKRRTIDETKHLLERAVQQCDGESDRLDDVLEFFSLDIGPSKHSK